MVFEKDQFHFVRLGPGFDFINLDFALNLGGRYELVIILELWTNFGIYYCGQSCVQTKVVDFLHDGVIGTYIWSKDFFENGRKMFLYIK
jgi:hypothetical protein